MKKNENTKVTESEVVVDEQGNVLPNAASIDVGELVKDVLNPVNSISETMAANNANITDVVESGISAQIELAKLVSEHPKVADYADKAGERIERMTEAACETSKEANRSSVQVGWGWYALLGFLLGFGGGCGGYIAVNTALPQLEQKFSDLALPLPKK